MPYITQKQKDRLGREAISNCGQFIETSGELNYLITDLCKHFIKQHGSKYSTYNDVIGVLECSKQELYRRVVSLYEDEKRLINGDVYD